VKGFVLKTRQLSTYIQVFRLFQGFLHTLPKIFHKVHIDLETCRVETRDFDGRRRTHGTAGGGSMEFMGCGILHQLRGLISGKPPMIYRLSIILLVVEMSQPSTV
jgi:hypothetical protein